MDPQPGARSRSSSSGGVTASQASSSSSSPSSPSPPSPPPAPPMRVCVRTTTGARYELALPAEETVEGLQRRLAQRLRLPRHRLALLHRDSRLSSGKLQDLGVGEGSKLTLVPTVEAGLMSQASRPEQSVMQALESLTETQVNDFLSGRSPLTLALRVGDHMMFVQLQLAAQQSGGPLQHRHVGPARGEPPGATPVAPPQAPAPGPGGGGPIHDAGPRPTFSRAPHVLACQPSPPASPPVAPPPPCGPAHPVMAAGMFRSHGTSTPAANGSAASSSSCSEVDCAARSSPSPSPSQPSRTRKPGAVIESFVNHAPGVFSGTFSGTLHPNCQDSAGRPRRDIGTILQILNDLLSATRHYQGMPPSLAQLRCQAQCALAPSPPSSPHSTNRAATSEKMAAAMTAAAASQPLHLGQGPVACKPIVTGDRVRQTENRATRCKVERLQLLMQQKRLRRKARRDARAPYHWLPNHRKSSRTNSNSSLSSEGSSSLDLDFDDSVWKPEVKPDMKSEFVVA
nr:midnolin [Anolis sagrei ordinatus]